MCLLTLEPSEEPFLPWHTFEPSTLTLTLQPPLLLYNLSAIATAPSLLI